MKVTILAIGRNRDADLERLIGTYRDRCPWHVAIVELLPRKGESEAERILRAIPQQDVVIALDEQGELATSGRLAARIGDWRDAGRDLTLVIGGADGLAPAIIRRSDWTLALGRLTWPHMLVRLMVMEQLYRAGTILTGHPYHRG